MATNPSEGREQQEIRIGWQMAGLGFEVAGSVVAGAALGWLFDRWRGTAPIGALVGSLLGIVIGLFTLVRKSLALNRRLEEAARRRRARGEAPPAPLPMNDEDEDEDDDAWRRKWDDDDEYARR